jgi:hypothetical protein
MFYFCIVPHLDENLTMSFDRDIWIGMDQPLRGAKFDLAEIGDEDVHFDVCVKEVVAGTSIGEGVEWDWDLGWFFIANLSTGDMLNELPLLTGAMLGTMTISEDSGKLARLAESVHTHVLNLDGIMVLEFKERSFEPAPVVKSFVRFRNNAEALAFAEDARNGVVHGYAIPSSRAI